MPPSNNPNAVTVNSHFPSQIIPMLFATSHLCEPLNAFICQLSTANKKVVVIYDSAMAWVIQDITSITNVECYLFNSISVFQIYTLMMNAGGLPFPEDGPRVLKEIPSLHGCFPDELWEYWHIQEKFFGNSCGCLHNTSREVEGLFLDLLEKEGELGSLKHWAIGPFNPMAIPERIRDDSGKRHECLNWLDNQARNTVEFVSFGTTTSLSAHQIVELANGLEKSEKKFVWLLRDADNADIFSREEAQGRGKSLLLPRGYEERLRGRGIIVRDLVPQLEILAHPATGGFLSHYGWNSCMESMSMGVTILAWPMHSDQPRNAVLMTKFLKIGILVRDWERRQELMTSSTIEECIIRLMDSEEGEEMRRKAMDLSCAIKGSVMDDGVARKEFDSFVAHITR